MTQKAMDFTKELLPFTQFTRVDTFAPMPGHQEQIFKSIKHQLVVGGGNKAGKTYCLCIRSALRSIPEKDANGENTGWLRDPYIRKKIPGGRKVMGWISTYSQNTQLSTVQETFDQIFKPYLIEPPRHEGGVYYDCKTEVADIQFRWISAGQMSYTGANIDWGWMDEPHPRNIYNEMVARTLKTKGYIWIGLTPVIDAKDPDYAMKLRYIQWMSDELIIPYEKNKDSLPELQVIYIHVEENTHVDSAFIDRQFAHLTHEERIIRKSGKFLTFLGKSIFDKDMIQTIQRHLLESEDSIPRYVELIYEGRKADTFEIVKPLDIASSFPDYPEDSYTWKIWEMPVGELDTEDYLGNRPDYVIGVDPAGDAYGDYTAAYIRRVDTGRVVAALHGHIDERKLAKELWLGGYFYCSADGKPALLSVENNMYGKVTLAYLFSGDDENDLQKYDRSRLYRRPSRSDLELNRPVRSDDFGWLTTGKTRGWLITNMREAVQKCYYSIDNNEQVSVPDLAWINEADTFIENLSKNGKVEAAVTFYDDRLMALAIADEAMKQRFGQIIRMPEVIDEVDEDTIFYSKDGKTHFNVKAVLDKSRHKKSTGGIYYINRMGGTNDERRYNSDSAN